MKISNYERAETSNIDYKEVLEEKKPKSWLKSVSAFVNTKGGIILFGIEDKGKNLTFDALPTEYNTNDLSFTLLAATIKERAKKKI